MPQGFDSSSKSVAASSASVPSGGDNTRQSKPFAGCPTMLAHYRTIGRELAHYESGSRRYRLPRFTALSELREGLAFVPVEVLEAYLEDLLVPTIPEEHLFLDISSRVKHPLSIAWLGCIAAIGVGVVVYHHGGTPLSATSATALLSLPSLFWLFISPREHLARRLRLARALSQEIARRRGRLYDDDDSTGSPRLLLIPRVA